MNKQGANGPQPSWSLANRATPITPRSSRPTPIRTAIAGASFPLIAPPTADARKAPPASHSRTKPESIGVKPITFCNQSGIAKRIPNSPIEMISAASDPFLNDATLNSFRSSSTGLCAASRLFSQRTKAIANNTDKPRATGIGEIPGLPQVHEPTMNSLFTCHQP